MIIDPQHANALISEEVETSAGFRGNRSQDLQIPVIRCNSSGQSGIKSQLLARFLFSGIFGLFQ